MLLKELLGRVKEARLAGEGAIEVTGISYDSRTVVAGHLFVAIKGEKADGRRFIPQAVARGASAVAFEEPLACPVPFIQIPDARKFLAQASHVLFDDPSSRLKLVGVTGTNGKTTTTYLIHSIFKEANLKSCLLGTIGMKVGDRSFSTKHTTPEAPDLDLLLRQSVDEGCTHGTLEVSSHALALKRVFGTQMAVAIFTNLTPDHLDFHHDMGSYYQAKRILFRPEGENRVDAAAINIDDPWGRRLASETDLSVIRYGYESGSDVRVIREELRIDGAALRIETPRGSLDLRTHLPGRPNTYNTLAAVSASIALGIGLSEICRGIESLEGVPGRMERVDCGQPFTVIVDYAHTPDALDRMLETIAQLPHRRILTVFGCGGDRDRTKRPVMGEIASRHSDCVLATSDNPRSEDPERILAEIEPGLRAGRSAYRLVTDRRAAIGEAVAMAQAGDVVLIAGKGHEDYQVIGDQLLPFDDRRVAREFLLKRPDVRGAQN